jgi:hypothetical protein
MKKKLYPAELPLPKFQSDRHAAKYFEGHSVTDVLDRLPKAPLAKLSAAVAQEIRDRQSLHGSDAHVSS